MPHEGQEIHMFSTGSLASLFLKKSKGVTSIDRLFSHGAALEEWAVENSNAPHINQKTGHK